MENDTHDMRQKMLSERGFLHSLYSDSINKNYHNVQHNIRTATEHQLNLLILILQQISQKRIPIPAVHRLIESKREPILSKLKNVQLTQKLLAASHPQKVEFLEQ